MTCSIIVAVPTVRGVSMLSVYGRLEIEDVPSPAAIENAIPSDIIHSPMTSTAILPGRILFMISCAVPQF